MRRRAPRNVLRGEMRGDARFARSRVSGSVPSRAVAGTRSRYLSSGSHMRVLVSRRSERTEIDQMRKTHHSGWTRDIIYDRKNSYTAHDLRDGSRGGGSESPRGDRRFGDPTYDTLAETLTRERGGHRTRLDVSCMQTTSVLQSERPAAWRHEKRSAQQKETKQPITEPIGTVGQKKGPCVTYGLTRRGHHARAVCLPLRRSRRCGHAHLARITQS